MEADYNQKVTALFTTITLTTQNILLISEHGPAGSLRQVLTNELEILSVNINEILNLELPDELTEYRKSMMKMVQPYQSFIQDVEKAMKELNGR